MVAVGTANSGSPSAAATTILATQTFDRRKSRRKGVVPWIANPRPQRRSRASQYQKIPWTGYLSTKFSVHNDLNIPQIISIIINLLIFEVGRLRWLGHLFRMSDQNSDAIQTRWYAMKKGTTKNEVHGFSGGRSENHGDGKERHRVVKSGKKSWKGLRFTLDFIAIRRILIY